VTKKTAAVATIINRFITLTPLNYLDAKKGEEIPDMTDFFGIYPEVTQGG